jgi:hypothetical protein
VTDETWNLAHIIYYKDGKESMGMHSDCMLDLASGSKIAVVSLGCNRELDLMKKHESISDGPSEMNIDLPNNSLFLLDEETNKHYVHGIKKEKTQIGDRVSIVFRQVVTFKTENGKLYGNGLTCTTKHHIIQRDTRLRMFKRVFTFLLSAFVIWLLPLFSTNSLNLATGRVCWFFISLIIGQIEQVASNYMNKTKTNRLHKLCKLKNFKTWNQTEMREFLKFK